MQEQVTRVAGTPVGLGVKVDAAIDAIGHAIVMDLLHIGPDLIHVLAHSRQHIWRSAVEQVQVLQKVCFIARCMVPACSSIRACMSIFCTIPVKHHSHVHATGDIGEMRIEQYFAAGEHWHKDTRKILER